MAAKWFNSLDTNSKVVVRMRDCGKTTTLLSYFAKFQPNAWLENQILNGLLTAGSVGAELKSLRHHNY